MLGLCPEPRYGECCLTLNAPSTWRVGSIIFVVASIRLVVFTIRNLKESKPVTMHLIPMEPHGWVKVNAQTRMDDEINQYHLSLAARNA